MLPVPSVVVPVHTAWKLAVPLPLTPPPPGGAAHVPSARRKLLVPPPLAGTTPAAAVPNVPTVRVRLPLRAPPPARGAVVEIVRVVGTPPRFARAVAATVAPVPPLAMATGTTRAAERPVTPALR